MAIASDDAAIAQYQANAGYDVNASASEARLFIEAARYLLSMPKRVRKGRGSEIEMDPVRIETQLNAALRWLAQYSSAGANAPRFASFRNSRC